VNDTGQMKETARAEASHVADTAAQKGDEVAGAAKQQAQHLAESARSEASQVLGTATDQAKTVLNEMTGELSQKADEQAGRLSERLRELSKQLRSMAEKTDQQGFAVSAVDTLGEQSEKLADRLKNEGTAGIASDVRRYARSNPGSFLLGALITGAAAGRISRGVKDESKKASGGQSSSQPSGGVPVTAAPPVPVVEPGAEPVYPPVAGTPVAEPYPTTQTGGRL
jgi:vacuolar-type H+-ATPase subunit H